MYASIYVITLNLVNSINKQKCLVDKIKHFMLSDKMLINNSFMKTISS